MYERLTPLLSLMIAGYLLWPYLKNRPSGSVIDGAKSATSQKMERQARAVLPEPTRDPFARSDGRDRYGARSRPEPSLSEPGVTNAVGGPVGAATTESPAGFTNGLPAVRGIIVANGARFVSMGGRLYEEGDSLAAGGNLSDTRIVRIEADRVLLQRGETVTELSMVPHPYKEIMGAAR